MDAEKYLATCQDYVENKRLVALSGDWKNLAGYFKSAEEQGNARCLTVGLVEIICGAYFDGRKQGVELMKDTPNPREIAKKIQEAIRKNPELLEKIR